MEAHNTLVSNIDESRRNLTAIEQTLAEMSARMLSGVATKYGTSSNEYRKAGGTPRKRRNLAMVTSFPEMPQTALSNPSAIEFNDGKGAKLVSN